MIGAARVNSVGNYVRRYAPGTAHHAGTAFLRHNTKASRQVPGGVCQSNLTSLPAGYCIYTNTRWAYMKVHSRSGRRMGRANVIFDCAVTNLSCLISRSEHTWTPGGLRLLASEASVV
jgi:hypothetical protein